MRTSRKAGLANWMAFEPRRVGDLTFSGYWHTFSLVLDVSGSKTGHGPTWITELNLMAPNELVLDGTVSVKRHLTPWNYRRDHIVAERLHVCDEFGPGWHSYDEYITYLKRRANCWERPATARPTIELALARLQSQR